MRTPRLWRLAVACRLAIVTTVGIPAWLASAGAASAADRVLTGSVTDQSGQPLPRAFIRIVDRAGAEATTTFADELGHFRVTAAAACHVEASLSGFEPAQVDCDAKPLRLTLKVAPIHESVVVTATRTEAPSGQIGASVTVFTADDLERRQVPLVADLLRAAPGVMVVRTGAPGAVTSLFVRGGESNYNKVLLDGIPLNEPGGTFNFSNLTTENLERIEFVRGAHSALFGSDAMASVVQLVTKRPDRSERRPRATASLEGGSYNTVRGGAAVSGAAGAFDYVLGAQRYSTDNRAPNSDFENTTLSASIGAALPGGATLRFVSRGELEHAGTPGQTAFGRPDLDAFFERHDGVFGLTFDQPVSPSFRQRATYSTTMSHFQSTNLLLDPPYTARFEDRVSAFPSSDFAFDSRTRLHRHHASYQADWRLSAGAAHGDQRLTMLADWDGERAQLESRLAGTQTTASRDNFGWSIQHQALWRRTFATAGARVEHNESFGNAAVPRGSIVFMARTAGGAVGDTKLKTSAGLGIKEPTVLQSFSLSPSFPGNPDLDSERSRSVEAGIEQRFGNDRVKTELTWFDNRFRNIISTRTVSLSPFRGEYFNVGLTRARGAEISIDVAPVSSVRTTGGYTFLDSKILESTSPTNVVFQKGQWAFRRPRHSGYVGVTVVQSRLTANLNGLFVGHFVDSDFVLLQPPMVTNPGRITWDARFAYAVSRQVKALVSIDNLTNADYMEPLGYQVLQRAVRVGIRVGY